MGEKFKVSTYNVSIVTSLIVYWLELKKIILEVVIQKYPLTPWLAYEKAKLAANKAGRERNSILQVSVRGRAS